MITRERWKRCLSFPKYDVSIRGNVRRNRGYKTRLLSPVRTVPGYLRVTMYDAKCRARLVFVHVLVAEAFLGACPDGYEIDHVDGNKSNARLSNLEYVTHSENLLRMRARMHSNNQNISKLSVRDVQKIRARLSNGETRRSIAKHFDVTPPNISMIALGKTWAWLK